jgi:predicted RNA binding protein with dsRBD fold (UPF0201 family)
LIFFKISDLELEADKLNISLQNILVSARQVLDNGLTDQAIHFISTAQQVHDDIMNTLGEIKKRNRSLLS